MPFKRSCALCGQNGPEFQKLGRLLGPLRDSKAGQELYVHRLCALWSPEVFQTEQGTLRNVLAAVRRGRQVYCRHCGQRGATLGCLLERCPCSYHLPCAQQAGAIFHCLDFTLTCCDHAKLFPRKPEEEGLTPFTTTRPFASPSQTTPARSRTHMIDTPGPDPLSPPTLLPPAKRPCCKRGLHSDAEVFEHMLAARAALKRARHEQRIARLAAEQSSDDEEHFSKKEVARLARDRGRLNPATLGGQVPAVGVDQGWREHGVSAAGGAARKAQQQRDGSGHYDLRHDHSAAAAPAGAVADTDFGSVAGLDAVVGQLREMVLLPLIYPKLFQGMGIAPPRGILFHGEPGTGKTLAARALAGACARHSPVPVTLFARKGADCLGKFSGEAERTLRLLFQEASSRAPAIIFLDELDALVPARAARAGGSDQIYASVVSTLLSLMDGVTDRGNVVVIGATNRPDAIDPALRRPGRFDREVYFGLPGPQERAAILGVHTRQWPSPPPPPLLHQVAGLAEGFAGADLQALCTAAVLAAVRRAAPALLEDCEEQETAGQDSEVRGAARGRAAQLLEGVSVEEGDWWEALAAAPAPCSRRHALAALSAGAAQRPLPFHLMPLLGRPLRTALRTLHASALPLPAAASAAAAAASMHSSDKRSSSSSLGDPAAAEGCVSLEGLLEQLGAVQPTPPAVHSSSSRALQGEAPPTTSGQPSLSAKPAPQQGDGRSCYPPCRLLLAGEGDMGQERCTAVMLKLLEGCSVHTVSLPTALLEGGGDASAGCVKLVREALGRASAHRPTLLHLPRLDTWAVHSECVQTLEGQPGAGPGMSPESSGGARCSTAPSPLLSPRFGGRATPRSAGFRTATSPFGGLVDLEERMAGSSPSAARALRAEVDARQPARSRHSAGPSQVPPPETSLTCHPPQPIPPSRPLSWGEIRGQALQPEGGSPLAGAQPMQVGGGNTPPHCPAVPAVHGPAAAVGAAAEVALHLPPLCTSLGPHAPPPRSAEAKGSEERAEAGVCVCAERTQLSEMWNVLEASLRGSSSAQPLILLATSHAPLGSLPPLLLSFFGGGRAREVETAGSAAQVQQLHSDGGCPGGGGGVQGGCGVVVLEGRHTEAEEEASLRAAGAEVAARVAACASTALLGALAVHAERGAGAAPEAGALGALPSGKGCPGGGGPGVGDGSGAEPGATVGGKLPEDELGTGGGVRGGDPARQQVAAALGAGMSPPPLPQRLSRAELDRGLGLLRQLQRFQRWLGGGLGQDPRCGLAKAWVYPKPRVRGAGGGCGRGGPLGEGSCREGEGELVAFSDVARRAKRGGYKALDDLVRDASVTAGRIIEAVGGSPDPAAVACYALLDEVEERCHTFMQQQGTRLPGQAALLAKAWAYVADWQSSLQAQHAQQPQQGPTPERSDRGGVETGGKGEEASWFGPGGGGSPTAPSSPAALGEGPKGGPGPGWGGEGGGLDRHTALESSGAAGAVAIAAALPAVGGVLRGACAAQNSPTKVGGVGAEEVERRRDMALQLQPLLLAVLAQPLLDAVRQQAQRAGGVRPASLEAAVHCVAEGASAACSAAVNSWASQNLLTPSQILRSPGYTTPPAGMDLQGLAVECCASVSAWCKGLGG